MSAILNYKIEIFWSELMRFVDVHEAFTGDFLSDPFEDHSDFVGKIKWGKFTIYQKSRYFLTPRISLVIKGQIEKNELSFKIRFPYFWYFIFSEFILTVSSLQMMMDLSFKYGLILFIITYVQAFLGYGLFLNRKQKFIEHIDGIISKINRNGS